MGEGRPHAHLTDSLSAIRLKLVTCRQYGLQASAWGRAWSSSKRNARMRPRGGARALPSRTPPLNYRTSFYPHLVLSIFNGAKYSRYTVELSESSQFSLTFLAFAWISLGHMLYLQSKPATSRKSKQSVSCNLFLVIVFANWAFLLLTDKVKSFNLCPGLIDAGDCFDCPLISFFSFPLSFPLLIGLNWVFLFLTDNKLFMWHIDICSKLITASLFWCCALLTCFS